MLDIIIRGLCIAFCGLLFWLMINIFSIIAFDKDTGQLCHLLWKKINAKNDAYKDFVRNTEGQKRVVELPFSVIQPLLRDDSPIIVFASNDRLAIRDEKSYYSIHVKLSKKDYDEYIKFLEQKKENKEKLEKTEDTLAATQLINKELKRINEEALKSVQKNTDDIKQIVETCEYLNFEEPAKDSRTELRKLIDENNKKIEQFFCTDGTVYEFERSTKFDWELVNDIFKGKTAIVVRDITEYFQFRTSGLADIIYCNTSNTIGYPRIAYYDRVTDRWFVEPYDTRIFNATVNTTELFKCCPDFVTIFNKKIQDTGVRYD